MKKILLSVIVSALFLGLSMTNSWSQTTFNYTGAMQTYVVPSGVTSVQIELFGAEGYGSLGYGGQLQAEVPVTPGETLEIYVGGAGTPTLGGFNGGGDTGGNTGYGGGGGASDVRQGGSTFFDRILVAGGGGGTGSNCGSNTAEGGHGGDMIGGGGCVFSCSDCQYTGSGGTQVAGGIAGPTSHGSCTGNNDGTFGLGGDNLGGFGTGGGGGWYGGGSGCFEGAGGGSSYAIGTATNVSYSQGLQTGDGQIIITVLCTPLTVTVSSSTVCDGDMVTLDASSIGTGTVTWDNGVTSGVAFTPSLGTTTYTATSTDGTDCGFSVDILVNALPTVVGTVNNTTICLGDSIILNGAGADTYAWDNGAVDGVEFTPASAGIITYTVTGTDVNSCVNTGSVLVQVNQLVLNAAITHETAGNDGAIDLTVTGGTGTNTYSWSNGETTEDIGSLGIGTYTVTVNDGVCTDSASYTIINVLGIEDNEATSIEIYPNPTSGLITINVEGTFNYTIVNVLGEVVITGQGNNIENVDLTDMNRGTYFITIESDDNIEVLKIIKQ